MEDRQPAAAERDLRSLDRPPEVRTEDGDDLLVGPAIPSSLACRRPSGES